MKEKVCDICHKIVSRLSSHKKYTHSDGKNFDCQICDKTFVTKSDLNKHIKTNHKRKEIVKPKCSKCEKEFVSAQNLKTHVLAIHEKLKENSCSFCSKSFFSKGHMKRHEEQVHLRSNSKPKSIGPDANDTCNKK